MPNLPSFKERKHVAYVQKVEAHELVEHDSRFFHVTLDRATGETVVKIKPTYFATMEADTPGDERRNPGLKLDLDGLETLIREALEIKEHLQKPS